MKPVDKNPNTELEFQTPLEAFWSGIVTGKLLKSIEKTDELSQIEIIPLQNSEGQYLNAVLVRDRGREVVIQVFEIGPDLNEIRENLSQIIHELELDGDTGFSPFAH